MVGASSASFGDDIPRAAPASSPGASTHAASSEGPAATWPPPANVVTNPLPPSALPGLLRLQSELALSLRRHFRSEQVPTAVHEELAAFRDAVALEVAKSLEKNQACASPSSVQERVLPPKSCPLPPKGLPRGRERSFAPARMPSHQAIAPSSDPGCRLACGTGIDAVRAKRGTRDPGLAVLPEPVDLRDLKFEVIHHARQPRPPVASGNSMVTPPQMVDIDFFEDEEVASEEEPDEGCAELRGMASSHKCTGRSSEASKSTSGSPSTLPSPPYERYEATVKQSREPSPAMSWATHFGERQVSCASDRSWSSKAPHSDSLCESVFRGGVVQSAHMSNSTLNCLSETPRSLSASSFDDLMVHQAAGPFATSLQDRIDGVCAAIASAHDDDCEEFLAVAASSTSRAAQVPLPPSRPPISPPKGKRPPGGRSLHTVLPPSESGADDFELSPPASPPPELQAAGSEEAYSDQEGRVPHPVHRPSLPPAADPAPAELDLSQSSNG